MFSVLLIERKDPVEGAGKRTCIFRKGKIENCSFSRLPIHTRSIAKARYLMNPEILKILVPKTQAKQKGLD